MFWQNDPLRRAVGACALLSSLAAGAHATEGGGTAYPLGVATVNPGLEPSPPGFTFLNYNTFYTASHTRNSRGGDALPGFHVSVAVSSYRLDYTLPEGVMPPGWHLGAFIVQPIFNQELYTRAPTPRAQGRKVAIFGLGDLTVTPFSVGRIGNSELLGRVTAKFKLQVVAPTGDYDQTAFVNKGRNYFALQPQFGIQIFPRANISYGANFTYQYNFQNPATRYLSGQELIIEPVAEYSPVNNLWLGVQGYIYRQFTTDKINGAQAGDGRFGSVVAFGPQVRYSARGITFTAKWQHETLVRNRADGERFWLQLFLPL